MLFSSSVDKSCPDMNSHHSFKEHNRDGTTFLPINNSFTFMNYIFSSMLEALTSTAAFGTCLHVGTPLQKLIHNSYMATSGSQV